MKKKIKDEETWIDPKTNLEWQLEEPKKMTWEEALDFAEKSEYSGFADWRLPTVDELESLLDRSRCEPALREEVPFQDSNYYWTSVNYACNARFAWGVGFHGGGVNYYPKYDEVYVRCLRDQITNSSE